MAKDEIGRKDRVCFPVASVPLGKGKYEGTTRVVPEVLVARDISAIPDRASSKRSRAESVCLLRQTNHNNKCNRITTSSLSL
jgi:hypothetical protein